MVKWLSHNYPSEGLSSVSHSRLTFKGIDGCIVMDFMWRPVKYHVWCLPLGRSPPPASPIQIFHLLPLNSLLDAGNFLKMSVNLISYVSDFCFVKHCSSFCSRAGLRNTGASSLASAKVMRAGTAAWDGKELPLCMLLPVTYWRRTAAIGTAEKCLWFQGAWAVCRNYIARSHWMF